jgi:hypothetical protein
MLLFKTIIITILLIYLLVCVVVFSYRTLVRLLHSKTILFNSFRYAYPVAPGRNHFSSYKEYLNLLSRIRQEPGTIYESPGDCHHGDERRSDLPKVNKWLLCVFVPQWLFSFFPGEIVNNRNCFYFFPSAAKNKQIPFFKNIKAA